MIKNIKIENFRQFKNLEVDDFGVMNIFVGDNNVGKTSVLEAIGLGTSYSNFFHGSSFRNYAEPYLGNDLIIRTLFRNMELINSIIISIQKQTHTERREISSVVNIKQRDVILESFPQPPWEYYSLSNLEDYDLIGFRIKGVSGQYEVFDFLNLLTFKDKITLLSKSAFEKMLFNVNPGNFFVPTRKANSEFETIDVLNKLKDDKINKATLLGILKKFNTSIVDIFDINNYVALDIGLKKSIPLKVMGDGFNRVVSFLTGLFSANINTLLIDDMDSGLHFDAMVDVWKGLLTINQTRPFQLFCTTHSAEMLEAAVEAFADAPEKLRIYRLERHGEETIAKKFDWEKANLNLLNGGELRGVHRRG